MSDQHPQEPDPTTRMPGRGAAQEIPAAERTQRLPTGSTVAMPPARSGPISYTEESDTRVDAPSTRPGPISYTEEYSAQDGDPGLSPASGLGQGRDRRLSEEDEPRTFTTAALVLTSVAALLVGAVLTLLFLPEQDPQVVLTDQAAQQALVEAQTANADLATRIAELEGQLAERDAAIAGLEAAQAGDQAAADQAASDQQAALGDRENALNQRETDLAAREQTVASRETQVAEREQAVAAAPPAEAQPDGAADDTSGGGFELPEAPNLEIPADLPQIDEEAARGLMERFIDRVQSFFG